MKKGTRIQGEINNIDEKGRGVLKSNKKDYSVPFTMPGDEINAEFQKRSKNNNIAKVIDVATPSVNRVTATCPHAGVCGGCLWQQMKYDSQLECKRLMINRALEKNCHDIRIKEVTPSKDELFYRNRMDYAIGWNGELGLREYGNWNNYLDLETCLLFDKETPEILKIVRRLMKELKLEPWDNKFHRGNIKFLTMRRGEFTSERMIMLLFHDLSKINSSSKKKIEAALSPFCTTLYLGEQPTNTDTESANKLELIIGKPYLRERINNIEYDIRPNAFFQTNPRMARVLQNKVTELAEISSKQNILDLYCGLGFFSLSLAKAGARVTGIELMPESIELAKHNAELNKLSENTEFTAFPVEKHNWSPENYDTVIIDPSRAGLHPDVVRKLIEKPVANLIYISCNFYRFAEELTELKQSYTLTNLEAMDLFPQTPHVELIALLKRTSPVLIYS